MTAQGPYGGDSGPADGQRSWPGGSNAGAGRSDVPAGPWSGPPAASAGHGPGAASWVAADPQVSAYGAPAAGSPPAPTYGAAPNVQPYGAAPTGPGTPWGAPPPRAGMDRSTKRALLVVGIVTAALAVLTAVGVPTGIHIANSMRGDRLAEEFDAALASYEATWTSDALDSLEAAVVSDVLVADEYLFQMPDAAMADLASRCEAVTAAQTTLDGLVAAAPPELEASDGADASAAYRDAQTRSDDLAGARTAVSTLVSSGPGAIDELSRFCTNFPALDAVADASSAAYRTQYLPTLTVPMGGTGATGDNWEFTCGWDLGCPQFGDTAARAAFADAYTAAYIDYRDGTAELLHADGCPLTILEYACTTYADGNVIVADAMRTYADLARNEPINYVDGGAVLPGLDSAGERVSSLDDEQWVAFGDAWDDCDPGAVGDISTGWWLRGLQRMLGVHEAVLADGVAELR